MASFNKVILIGNLTADPELKQTPSGVSLVTFSLAVNRRFGSRDGQNQQPEADFFRITAWRNTAEFIAKYFRKGSAICICGIIQNRSWTDQNGQKRYVTDIIAEEANFVESRNTQDGQANYGATDAYSAPAYSSPAQGNAPKFEEIKTDDDLPF